MNNSKQKSVRVEFDEEDWELLRKKAFDERVSVRRCVKDTTLAALASLREAEKKSAQSVS